MMSCNRLKTIGYIKALNAIVNNKDVTIFNIDLTPYSGVSVGIKKNAILDFKVDVGSLQRQLKDIYINGDSPIEYIKKWSKEEIKKYSNLKYDRTYQLTMLKLYDNFLYFISNIRGLLS